MRLDLGEERRKIRFFRRKMRIPYRGKRAVVQKFSGTHPYGISQSHNSLCRIHNAAEVYHGACLVRRYGKRRHCDLGKETQRSLGAYHKVGNDLKRVRVRHQRPKIETGDIFYGVLELYPPSQFIVGKDIIPKPFNGRHYFRVTFPESGTGLGVSCIQHSSVGKNYAGAEERFVGVGVDAAAHAGGVVGHNPTHHAAADGSGIRAEVSAIRRQSPVNFPSHDSGLQRNGTILWIIP